MDSLGDEEKEEYDRDVEEVKPIWDELWATRCAAHFALLGVAKMMKIEILQPLLFIYLFI